MTDEQTNRVLVEKGSGNDSRDCSLWSWLSDFYSREMLSSTIVIWFWGILCLAVAVFSAVRFFQSEEVKDLILFATVFVCCVIFLGVVKIFAFHLIQRKAFRREIRRLELRLTELAAPLQDKRG